MHPEYQKELEALSNELYITISDIEIKIRDEVYFVVGDNEYLVLTEEEAKELVSERIKDNLWTLKSSFLCHYIDLGLDTDIEDEIVSLVQTKENKGNHILVNMVGNHMGKLVDDAIKNDGYGTFLDAINRQTFRNGFHIFQVS